MTDPGKVKKLDRERGQIAVEYVLLLVVGVGIWMILVNQLVSRSPTTPGVAISAWYRFIQFIGGDTIEQ